jgi:hypothetical protein
VTAHRRGCRRGLRFGAFVASTVLAVSAGAQQVVLSTTVPNCIPSNGNAVVSLGVKPDTGWSSVRVYFREHGQDAWYFLEMRSVGMGRYWATLPLPDNGNRAVDIRFVVRDENGVETTSELQQVPVTTDCKQDLTSEQNTFAHNLVVGETTIDQRDKKVYGFQCPGIVSRLQPDGDLRPDAYCRMALLALRPPKERLLLLLPLALVPGTSGGVIRGGGGGTISPSTP